MLIFLENAQNKIKVSDEIENIIRKAIELSLEELEEYSNYREWIDVCKGYY